MGSMVRRHVCKPTFSWKPQPKLPRSSIDGAFTLDVNSKDIRRLMISFMCRLMSCGDARAVKLAELLLRVDQWTTDEVILGNPECRCSIYHLPHDEFTSLLEDPLHSNLSKS